MSRRPISARALGMIVNTARRLESMFPGYWPDTKRSHYADFGWPNEITLDQLYNAYLRNPLAAAGIDKTIAKTWQDFPAVWENEDPNETATEKEIRQRFDDLRIWQKLMMADTRALVGGYAGVILRLADNKRFHEPADTVPGGLLGLVDVIPAWPQQLTVSEWDQDETSPTYGEPTRYRFNEASLQTGSIETTKLRQFDVHPSRVIVWSADGTVHARSALEPGYNALYDAEKISGAAGEGFWKIAKNAPILNADADTTLEEIASAMNVSPAEVAETMNEQIRDFSRGFDATMLLYGMEAKPLPLTLPSPADSFNIALQSFAASLNIPLKVLVGTQTGERASTEDARQWAQHNEARRVRIVRPLIMSMVNRLEGFGILPERDWVVNWPDLTESSLEEKLDRAAKMAGINKQLESDPPYTVDEIREVTGYDPLPNTSNDSGDTTL